MMALKKLIDDPTILQKKMKWVWTSFALTGGFCLLFALLPDMFFDFHGEQEQQMLHSIQGMTPDAFNQISNNLAAMHRAMFTSDCWRSFIIIAIGMAMLLLFKYKKLNADLWWAVWLCSVSLTCGR